MIESKIKSVEYSSRFLRSSTKLPKRIIEKAKDKEKLFKENPFDPRLKTHKLSGRDKGCWVFWVDNSYRIKFIFFSLGEVLFLDIGTHDIYK